MLRKIVIRQKAAKGEEVRRTARKVRKIKMIKEKEEAMLTRRKVLRMHQEIRRNDVNIEILSFESCKKEYSCHM